MIKAYRTVLTDSDLWNPDDDLLAESETAKLEKEWLPVAKEYFFFQNLIPNYLFIFQKLSN